MHHGTTVQGWLGLHVYVYQWPDCAPGNFTERWGTRSENLFAIKVVFPYFFRANMVLFCTFWHTFCFQYFANHQIRNQHEEHQRKQWYRVGRKRKKCNWFIANFKCTTVVFWWHLILFCTFKFAFYLLSIFRITQKQHWFFRPVRCFGFVEVSKGYHRNWYWIIAKIDSRNNWFDSICLQNSAKQIARSVRSVAGIISSNLRLAEVSEV